jgi:hypothetical protein
MATYLPESQVKPELEAKFAQLHSEIDLLLEQLRREILSRSKQK